MILSDSVHHRNPVQITPRALLVERCDAKTLTAKSVWRPHLYVEEHGVTILAGYVRAMTTWWGKGFKAIYYHFGPNATGRCSEFFTPDEAEAARFLIALAKEFCP